MPTPSSPEYQEAGRCYAQAILAERGAWDAARNCLPGTETFDARAWSRWQQCVALSNAARTTLLAMIQVTTVAGTPPQTATRADAMART